MDYRRFVLNPFYILELRPGCTRVDIERQGQKLLSLLEIGADIGPFATPLGRVGRNADMIHQALDLLRNPEHRAFYELWARIPPDPLSPPPPERGAPWPDALDSFGF
jgi:hypothetical protein